MQRYLTFVSAALALCLIILAGCGQEQSPVGPGNSEGSNVEQDTNRWIGSGPPDKDGEPTTQAIGAWAGIAWPFHENTSRWVGWQSDRYGGVNTTLCNGTRSSTHSGADYYARDLSRSGCYGVDVFAGIMGSVVMSGADGGYGNTVVIYDGTRRVAIRYSHLSEIAVTKGQYVRIGARIGKVGNSGFSTGPHLHLAAYENIDHFSRDGYPVIPSVCDSNWYACATYFFCA